MRIDFACAPDVLRIAIIPGWCADKTPSEFDLQPEPTQRAMTSSKFAGRVWDAIPVDAFRRRISDGYYNRTNAACRGALNVPGCRRRHVARPSASSVTQAGTAAGGSGITPPTDDGWKVPVSVC